ncbi:MAG TPA: hypothetical protein PKM08_02945 [Syntrophorhabdaceae bacterium]|nr:hypothetical protein [Syntrophorhabdaceae bacterium]HNT67596.1 hypothetical protein [Syntrophorhabdaceae bacterium]
MAYTTTTCPHCGFEMAPDYDYINKVKVLVCTKPTCLYRVYPDYPRRGGNEEVCYFCGRLFVIPPDGAGIVCPECKNRITQQKSGALQLHKRPRKQNQPRCRT